MSTPALLYLDHAATAPPLPEALDVFLETARTAYANPSSLHAPGAAAARVLAQARRDLLDALGAPGFRVVWTSTGTEANHLGIQGLARRLRGRAERAGGGPARVLYGALEHPSAGLAARALAEEGFQVEAIPADARGVIRPDALRSLLGPGVALVTVQWANNELGSLNPIHELAALTHNLAPHAAFHVDAVQAAGKRPEPIASLGADAVAVAAHKLGGVRGCAALLLREEGPEPVPVFLGGGHEGGLRSGTENVAGAAAFATAARIRRERLRRDPRRYHERRAGLLAALRRVVPDLVLLGPLDDREALGSILSIAFPGHAAEPLLHALEAEGVCAGSGSACHSHGAKESPVLAAIGFPRPLRNSVLRFSLDGSECPTDLERTAASLERALAAMRAH